MKRKEFRRLEPLIIESFHTNMKMLDRSYQVHNEEEDIDSTEEEFRDEIDYDNDCIISSNGWKYSAGCSGEFIGEFEEMGEALTAVKSWVEENKFYPNVWFVNDHGNVRQIDLDGNIIDEGKTFRKGDKHMKINKDQILKMHRSARRQDDIDDGRNVSYNRLHKSKATYDRNREKRNFGDDDIYENENNNTNKIKVRLTETQFKELTKLIVKEESNNK